MFFSCWISVLITYGFLEWCLFLSSICWFYIFLFYTLYEKANNCFLVAIQLCWGLLVKKCIGKAYTFNNISFPHCFVWKFFQCVLFSPIKIYNGWKQLTYHDFSHWRKATLEQDILTSVFPLLWIPFHGLVWILLLLKWQFWLDNLHDLRILTSIYNGITIGELLYNWLFLDSLYNIN